MLSRTEVCEIIQRAPIAFLATCHEGIPNVVPLGFKWADGEGLLVADLFLNKTRRNLEANSAVALSVATIDPKCGYQIKGRAVIHRSGPKYDRVQKLLEEAGVDTPPYAAVGISVDEVYLLDAGADAGKRLI